MTDKYLVSFKLNITKLNSKQVGFVTSDVCLERHENSRKFLKVRQRTRNFERFCLNVHTIRSQCSIKWGDSEVLAVLGGNYHSLISDLGAPPYSRMNSAELKEYDFFDSTTIDAISKLYVPFYILVCVWNIKRTPLDFLGFVHFNNCT